MQHGASVVIAAPGQKTSSYEHIGLAVRRFAVSAEVSDIRELYGEGDPPAAQEFARILDEERPDVVHLHAFTRGVSLRMLREAKRRAIKVVLTYHTPTVSCQRGTLMRWGNEVCDGVLDVQRCTACTLHGLGINKSIASGIASLPLALSFLPGKFGLQGGPWTALRMSELVGLRQSAFGGLMNEVDHIVALCHWTKDLLVKNGVPAEKITISRHGLPTADGEWRIANGGSNKPKSANRNPQSPLKIVFLGRLDETKGPDILIRAIRSLPEASLELHLYGIAQGDAGVTYLKKLKTLAVADPRIVFFPSVPSDETVELLRGYDLLVVPSRWLETGPLVVLEAFAAGIPVIGADLGGIAELVQHDINGLLVAPDSVEAWTQAIRRCCDDHTLVERLRRGIRLPRGMNDVAGEMLSLYRQTLKAEKANSIQSNRELHAIS
jgi:glycosyltransferase involved in cell wall biosynthesis